MFRSVFLNARKVSLPRFSRVGSVVRMSGDLRRDKIPDDPMGRLRAEELKLNPPATRKARKKPVITAETVIEPIIEIERDLLTDVKRAFKQIERGVKDMAELNKKHNLPFEIYYEKEDTPDIRLIIQTTRGKFQWYTDYTSESLMFVSYVTGFHGYHYYPNENLWLSKKFDQHEMTGMVTRDMIHHLVGCPDFNFPDMAIPGFYDENPTFREATPSDPAVLKAAVRKESGFGIEGADGETTSASMEMLKKKFMEVYDDKAGGY